MELSAREAGAAVVRQAAAISIPNLASSRAAGPDLLRALAILLVMLWHLPRPATPAGLEGLKQYSWAGVDLFFVLSGYLIGTQLFVRLARGQRLSLRDFYLKRAFRILPAFLVVLAVYVFLPSLRENPTLQAPWRFLTFTMNFGLDYRVTGGFTQAWSLCVEEHFYLVFPLLVLLLSRLRWQGWLVLLMCGVLFGGMLLRGTLWREALTGPLAEGVTAGLSPTYLKVIYYPTYCRLDGLLFGVLLAAFKAFKPDQWRRYVDPRWALVGGVATLALAVVVLLSGDAWLPRTDIDVGGSDVWLSFARARLCMPPGRIAGMGASLRQLACAGRRNDCSALLQHLSLAQADLACQRVSVRQRGDDRRQRFCPLLRQQHRGWRGALADR
jgi:peptidoglycan/LPS O-acetylase OafA/YrhL